MSYHPLKNDLYPLLKLAIPLALTGIVGASTGFFETMFLAKLGPEILAAGALVGWLYATFAVIMFGTLSSINILIAHKHGANDQTTMSLVARDGFLLSLLLTTVSFFLFWNMSPIFLLFGQSPSIVSLAESYLHALTWGLFPNLISNVIFQFIIGLGHTRTIMYLTVFGVSLVIFFSYVFIFGAFGFPALGIAGAGWGMTVSYWIIAIVTSVFVLTYKDYKHYFRSIINKNKPSYLWELLKVGFPIGAMYCFETGFFFALTLVMGYLGSQLLAANQIVMQYLCILMSIIFSIAQAITVRMGHLLGAKDTHLAKRAGYTGIMVSAIFMGIIAIVFWMFPSLLISVDIDIHNPINASIVNEIKILFAVSALFQIIEATRISLFGALRALKDTNFTLLASIISFWGIALPIGYLFATTFQFGGVGLWWGMVLGASCSVLLLYWRFNSKIRCYMPH